CRLGSRYGDRFGTAPLRCGRTNLGHAPGLPAERESGSARGRVVLAGDVLQVGGKLQTARQSRRRGDGRQLEWPLGESPLRLLRSESVAAIAARHWWNRAMAQWPPFRLRPDLVWRL